MHEPLLDVDFLFDELEELHLVLGPESIVILNVRETVEVCFRGLIATREEELGLLVKFELKGLIGRNQSAPESGFHCFSSNNGIGTSFIGMSVSGECQKETQDLRAANESFSVFERALRNDRVGKAGKVTVDDTATIMAGW